MNLRILAHIIAGGPSPYGEKINALIIDLSRDPAFGGLIERVGALLEGLAPRGEVPEVRSFLRQELLLMMGRAHVQPRTPLFVPSTRPPLEALGFESWLAELPASQLRGD